MSAPLTLTREQVLAHRRRAGHLNERLPPGARSLRAAAHAGLTDSMPRAALLSLHARVEGIGPDAWADPSLVQVWGPRFSVYVVAKRDWAPFTLGRLPDDAGGRTRSETLAARLREHLGDSKQRYGDAGDALAVNPNALRYAAQTGTVLIRWEGARQPLVWCVDAPTIDATRARGDLARRYLHVFGPASAADFAEWAGIPARAAEATFAGLRRSLLPTRTEIGDGFSLTTDEDSLRAGPQRSPDPGGDGAPAVRLLPSGDAYFLLWGAQRTLLVPDRKRCAELWTSRVWPGALLVDGEVEGTWRRAGATLDVHPWRRLSRAQRAATETEAASLPLPGLTGPIRVRWE